MNMISIERLRLNAGAEHLHRLGACAVAEALAEIATRIGGLPAVLAVLGEYRNRPTPEMIDAANPKRVARRHPNAAPPRVVPRATL